MNSQEPKLCAITDIFFGAFPAAGPRAPDVQSDPRDVVHLDVEYPSHYENVSVPDEHLFSFVKELRKNLELSVSLEDEIGGYGLHNLSPIEPDAERDGISSKRNYGISKLVLTYIGLFRRLLEIDAQRAKHEVLAWQSNNDPVFSRLRIWACGDRRIISGTKAGRILSSLNQDVFWNNSHQRDFLLVLARRWQDLSVSARRGLGHRLLRGRLRYEGETKKEFIERKAWLSLSRIYWLQNQGCQFSFDIEKETAKLKVDAPGWQPASSAAASTEGRSGWVRKDTRIDPLLSEPLATLLDKAQELSGQQQDFFVERDPFAGLSTEKPIRAFAALVVAAKKGRYPESAWRSFLNSEARKTDKVRLLVEIAERLSRLPNDQLAELVYPISEWLLVISESLLAERRETFLQLWARLLDVLKFEASAATLSRVRGGKEPDWATESINAPVGKIAQAIMNDPQKNDLKLGGGFPTPWIERVDELLSLKDDLRRHALVIFSFNMGWFFAIDPRWTETNLISVLAQRSDDSDAVWAGFFWAAGIPEKALYLKMKSAMLDLAKQNSLVRRQHTEILGGILLVGWRAIEKSSGERCVTDTEMCTVLLNADDEFRSRILWQLERWSSTKDGDWSNDALVFLKQVWPKQRAARSPTVSARLCELAFSSGDKFVEYVDCILPLVITIDQDHLSIPSDYNIIDKFPDTVLALLNAVLPADARKWPYGIDQALNRIGSANKVLLNDERLIELKHTWNAR